MLVVVPLAVSSALRLPLSVAVVPIEVYDGAWIMLVALMLPFTSRATVGAVDFAMETNPLVFVTSVLNV